MFVNLYDKKYEWKLTEDIFSKNLLNNLINDKSKEIIARYY